MILENINIDIDIDMVILENIDIDKAILQICNFANIDIDKISNRFKFGISNRAMRDRAKVGGYQDGGGGQYLVDG